VYSQTFENYNHRDTGPQLVACIHVCSIKALHSICGATAPSGPWVPSEDASILLCLLLVSFILVFLEYVMCPSGRLHSKDLQIFIFSVEGFVVYITVLVKPD